MASLPLYFLPLCLSLPPVFAFALCKHERDVERVTRAGQNSSPSPPQASVPRPDLRLSVGRGARASPRARPSQPSSAFSPLCGIVLPEILTAVINDLGGPRGRQRGAVRKHNKLVIPLQTSLLLTAAVFYPSAHYDFWGGKEDLRYEGYIWVKFGVITHLEPWVSTEQLFVLFPQRPGPL